MHIGSVFAQIHKTHPIPWSCKQFIKGVLMSATEATSKPVNFLINFWDIVTDPAAALANIEFQFDFSRARMTDWR